MTGITPLKLGDNVDQGQMVARCERGSVIVHLCQVRVALFPQQHTMGLLRACKTLITSTPDDKDSLQNGY
jgi:hypothetical protein